MSKTLIPARMSSGQCLQRYRLSATPMSIATSDVGRSTIGRTKRRTVAVSEDGKPASIALRDNAVNPQNKKQTYARSCWNRLAFTGVLLWPLRPPNGWAHLTGNTECSEAKRRVDWSGAVICYALLSRLSKYLEKQTCVRFLKLSYVCRCTVVKYSSSRSSWLWIKKLES